MLPALAEAIEHEDMTELAEVLSTRAVEVNSRGSGRWVGFLPSTLGSILLGATDYVDSSTRVGEIL
jgi:hypothetical protein